jgi:type IV secretion system protein TrbL
MAGIPDCVAHPLSCGEQIIGGAVSGAASSGLQALADGAFTMLGKVLKLLATFWISAPAAELASPQSAVQLVQVQLRPLAMFALILGLLGASGRLMWTARSGEPGAFSQAVKGIAQTIVVTGAGALIVSVLLDAFDQWANHILNTGFDGKGVGEQIAALAAGANPGGQLGAMFSIVLFGLAALSSLLQYGLMLVRAPVLVLLCATWPVTAASAVTKEGSEAFRRQTSWLLSWILYKLVAAIIYATAFAMLGDSKDESGTVQGLILLVLAAAALPGLMRLISPATQAIPGGGGQLMTAAAGAGGQIAGATMYSRAGRTAQNHQVGTAQPFSGTGAAATGAAQGAPGQAGRAAASNAGTAGSAGKAAASPAAGAAGAGTASKAATAAGPVGAAADAGAQAIPAARQGAENAAGAADGKGGT